MLSVIYAKRQLWCVTNELIMLSVLAPVLITYNYKIKSLMCVKAVELIKTGVSSGLSRKYQTWLKMLRRWRERKKKFNKIDNKYVYCMSTFSLNSKIFSKNSFFVVQFQTVTLDPVLQKFSLA
jgi:hypothetical protein